VMGKELEIYLYWFREELSAAEFSRDTNDLTALCENAALPQVLFKFTIRTEQIDSNHLRPT
jgi:hypothetical protein